ncbi:MAG: OmpA family protein [Chitinophagaceae bacterium]|nr:OmpA family protein [Chitinophagaceae bacterium]
MKKWVFLLFILGSVQLSFGQWYNPDKVSHKASSLFNQAYDQAMAGAYGAALELLQKAVAIDTKYIDAYLSMAGIHGERKEYAAAVASYKKAIDLDSVYTLHYQLPYSINLAGIGHFEEALAAINKFLTSPKLNERSRKAGEFRKTTYEFAVNLAKTMQQGYVFNPVNLGDSINTADLEYFPTLTIDGNTLIFTRRIGNNEDFYQSNRVNGIWQKAHLLEGNINTPNYNEGAQIISQDGKWLIFTGCNFPQGLGSCDLYISFLTKKGWSKPMNLGPNVNSEFWESTPSLSPDKRDLYFSSNVPGGFGGKDIWVSHRNDDGTWSEPTNLGAEINTAGDESTPFIHADNQTLYFNSNGLPGYSEKPDLFVTRKQPDGSWSTPQNLGYPINTIDDEGSLFIAADGITAYYSSDRSDTKGGLDIYSFQLPDQVRPMRTLWVQGKVFDKHTKAQLPSAVELTDLETGNMISRVSTDEDGEFLVTLPVGRDYAFTVRRKGYLFFSENYNISATAPDETFVAEIPLQPIETDASVVLKNIFFNTGKSDLKPESIVELNNIVTLMNENPTLRIQIIGFTDNVGSEKDNLKLSNDRALSVVNYLITHGVKAERLSHLGKGASNPVADNNTEEGRAQNRRTEMKVVAK